MDTIDEDILKFNWILERRGKINLFIKIKKTIYEFYQQCKYTDTSNRIILKNTVQKFF